MFMMLNRVLLALLWITIIGQAPSAAIGTSMQASHSTEAMKDLITKARRQGTVRVIATLSMEFVPEGQLPDHAAVNKQRQAIAALQAGVLDALHGCTVEAIRRYRYTPTIALEVDACGLTRLIHAPEVSRITEDRLLPPAQPSVL